MAGIIQKGARRFTTQIGAAGVADGAVTTIPLVSVTGLPTDTPIEIIIDRTDASGNFTPAKEEVVRGTVSGTDLINCTRGVEGTPQAHSAGATVNALLTASMWNQMSQYILDIGQVLYPVGSIYTSVVNTNPSTYFGGTWVVFASGRTLVGVDTGQTEFDTVEETGGNKNLQTHNHGASGLTTNSTGAHTHRTDIAFPYSSNNTGFAAGGAGAAINGTDGLQSGSAGDHSHTISGNTANAGTGNAGNLQPYITVYFFKRTA